MSVTTISKAGIADDAVDNTKLDVSGNYDFSGTVNFTGTTTGVGVPSTPYFRARNEATQSLSNGTDTIIHFQHDVFDPQGTFNNSSSSNTLNGISTDAFSFAPNVAGYYLLGASCHFQTVADGTSIEFKLRKNQSTIIRSMIHSGNASKDLNPHVSVIEQANGTSDDFQVSVRLDGSGDNTYYDKQYVTFWGYRIA